MNSLFSLLTHPWAEAIGWTLLHSLWQGLVVVLLAKLALHFIPANRANVRYVVALTGLALILAGSVVTASLLLPEEQVVRVASSYSMVAPVAAPVVETPSSPGFIHTVARYLDAQIPLIVALWMIGVILFAIRFALGWAYISRLQATAIPVAESWRALLEDLKKQFGLTLDIRLSESNRISVPAVVGFFKPVILVPVGMFTGLSQQQVEAVLLHELTHIRRQDFLINTIQSVLEVLYFFNPFVWMLSSAARNEREYCCDDQVVNRYHPRVYAEALAYLETSRMKKPALALSLTGETNNLLYRIQRFMEKSKRNNPVPQWMAPLVLAVAGIISMSWLTIGSDPAQDEAARLAHAQNAPSVVVADTIKPVEKRAVWKRKKTVTIGKDGQPHEETVESFEGDEELRDEIARNFNFDYDFDFKLDSGSFTWKPDSGNFTYNFRLDFDSLIEPGTFYFDPSIYDFDSLSPFGDDVRAFREEFEKMFKDQFSEFYQKHGEDLQNMMDRLEEKFNSDSWHEDLERNMREMEEQMRNLREKMRKSELLDETRLHEEAMHKHALQMQEVNKAIAMQSNVHHNQLMAAHKQMEMAHRQVERANWQIHVAMKKHAALQEALRAELIKDGYLKKDEPLRSLRWTNDDMEVNGKKVKPKDAKKYKKLNDELLSE